MMTSSRGVTRHRWGTRQGKEVYLFRLDNGRGAYADVTNYGATLVSVVVPDRLGQSGNVVLGFPSLEGYLADNCYIGSTVGRCANRIGNATFTLDGEAYHLEKNDNDNNNHGGFNGFHCRLFDFEADERSVVFRVASEHLEGGFPGKVDLSVTYTFSEEGELSIEYRATTDRSTVLNITNHAYFNLTALENDISGHVLQIDANSVLETSPDWIPTGKILSADTLSFQGNTLRQKMSFESGSTKGLNVYYIFDSIDEDKARAVLVDPVSGRKLEVFTTYPGLQLYTGDFLVSKLPGHHGNGYKPFDGVCLECQFYPDSPNHEHFPSTILRPENEYYEKIVYKFSVAD